MDVAVKKRTHLMKVIALLSNNGNEMQQNEIGKALKLKGPNLSRIMNLLEGAEIIERNKHGRAKLVKLTEAGKNMASETNKPGDCGTIKTFL